MNESNKESLIKFAKVLALFIVGLIGIIVSANAMNDGGFYLVCGILNLGIAAWADYSLYKLFFKKGKEPKE